MDTRQIKKQLVANLLKGNPTLMAAEIAEIRHLLETRLDLAKGDKGDVGPSGPRGFQGESIRGLQGLPGNDGYTPIKNIDYFDGKPGKEGKQGLPGKDGKDADMTVLFRRIEDLRRELEAKDITVEQVIEALNKMKGAIDAKVIRNLPSNVQVYKPNNKKIDTNDLRWHGGGGDLSVANFHTQIPVGLIDGSNTVYTVTTTIHSVINFSINGEYISPAEYTFNGVTITFIHPLDASFAGTPFYITYV